ncbi:MAG: GDP-L-fucose synthase [Pseudolabrys sp.]|nr:GDP-L-fucose synthase [Pseudolabrys sp.]MSP32191.1 GDP-L-fucose synthase [Pseudolabrys sp.]
MRGKRVYVAGHNGLAGSAIVRRLAGEGCETLTASRQTLDLTRQSDTERWLEQMKPDAVIIAAGLVGGILANQTFPANFITDNLAICLNLIRGSHKAGVKKLLALGSSCIYPKFAPQPMPEDALLTGPLEPTNEWYAVAKIAAIKLCEAYRRQHGADFISAMPTNLYGRGDNYHAQNSHVPPALLRRFHEGKLANAPTVTVWGTGKPRREFLCSDDLADACVFLMKHYSDLQFLNVGTGEDVTIADFAGEVASVVGYKGKIAYDTSRPDGSPQKLLDVSKIKKLGWAPKIKLHDGLAGAYADFLAGGGRLSG